MILPTPELLALEQLVGAPENQPLDPPGGQDPLIARGLDWQYIAIIALASGAVAVVEFFSRRVEYAIYFAIFLSFVLIAFFFLA